MSYALILVAQVLQVRLIDLRPVVDIHVCAYKVVELYIKLTS